MIAMPPGWHFDEQARTLTAPNDWKIEGRMHAGRMRLVLSLMQGGATVAPNPNGGWDGVAQIVERLAKSGAKFAAVSGKP